VGLSGTWITFRTLEYVEYNMSTSIRISEETKQKLEVVKREDETFDELLSRLATTEKDVEELGGFADDGVVEDMARARDELNDSLEQRSDREA
jgi:predicted CopG family antitoxin